MVYNTVKNAVDEAAAENTSNASILESCLYITEYESKMFESLINIDFVQAVQEADLDTQEDDSETGNGATQDAPEANTTKKGKDAEVGPNKWQQIKYTCSQIVKKIKELLAKIKDAVINTFKNATTKIQEILNGDKKLVEKYGSLVKEARNIEGFEGLDNFNVPQNFNNNYFDTKSITDLVNKAGDIFGSTGLNEEIGKGCDQLLEDAQKNFNDSFKQEEKFIPDVTFMTNAVALLTSGSKQITNSITETGKNLVQTIRAMEEMTKKYEAEINKNGKESETYAAQWKDYSSAIAKICSTISKLTNISLNSTKATFKACRHAVFVVGKYASAKANKEANTNTSESVTLRYIIGEASDMYIEDVLYV